MRIGFYLDRGTFSIDAETTPRIMEALAQAGEEIVYFGPDQLKQGVRATIQFDYYRPKGKSFDHGTLASLDVLVLRKDPPVDHIVYSQLAELEQEVHMINRPSIIRRDTKEFMEQDFLEPYAPETKFTMDPETICAMLQKHGKVIIKPIDGYAGKGIFAMSVNDYKSGMIEEATHNGTQKIVVQEYLDAVKFGDKRITVIDGDSVGAALRKAKAEGALCNRHQGATVHPTDVTQRESQIIAEAWPRLAADGIHYAGFDFIGEMLIELNFTSPGFLDPVWKELYPEAPITPAEHFAEYILKTVGRN